MQHIGHLILLFSFAISASAQDLGELEYEEMVSSGIIVDDSSTSLLIIESTVKELQFRSRIGISKVDDSEPGIYLVFLPPGVHIVEVVSERFLPLKLPRLNFQPKSAKKFRVRAREASVLYADRNPELRLTWSDLPAGDVYVQVDSDPIQKIISASGGVTLRPPAGQRSVRVVAGGRQWQRDMLLREEQEYSEVVQMESEATELVSEAYSGGLYVESEPPGARVYINGVEKEGLAPLRIKGLSPGRYMVELRLRQHVTTQLDVEVKELEIRKLNMKLEPLYGKVTLLSEPSGAVVYVDNEQLGETPVIGRLDAGRHIVRLIAPLYWDLADTLVVEAGQEEAKSYKMMPRFGSVAIVSDPTGANVKVDGEEWGQTPVKRVQMRSGVYTVEASLEPYGSDVHSLIVKDGQETRLLVDLKRKVGALSLISEPSGAEVTLVGSGRVLGITPIRDVLLAPGIYTVRFEANGYDVSDKIVPVEAGVSVHDTTRLVAKLGHVEVDSDPAGASVYVDGKLMEGTTPLIVQNIPVGSRQLVIKLSGYNEHEQQVDVKQNELFDVSVVLVGGNNKLTEDVRISSKTSMKDFVDTDLLGLAVQELTSDFADYEDGVVILHVREGSEADRRGLYPNMLIRGVNRIRVRNVADYESAIATVRPSKEFVLHLQYGSTLLRMPPYSDRGKRGLSRPSLPEDLKENLTSLTIILGSFLWLLFTGSIL